ALCLSAFPRRFTKHLPRPLHVWDAAGAAKECSRNARSGRASRAGSGSALGLVLLARRLARLIAVFLHLLAGLARLLARRLSAVLRVFLGLLLLRLLLLVGLVLIGHYKSPKWRNYSARIGEQLACPAARPRARGRVNI
ncbi:hypothetical protein ABE485_30880, partial [Achromobacter spanius]|uniref:hypothetical protein n=1 Tax=Achromobacter spanius TaxID=217203 RepID=UPI00320A382E